MCIFRLISPKRCGSLAAERDDEEIRVFKNELREALADPSRPRARRSYA